MVLVFWFTLIYFMVTFLFSFWKAHELCPNYMKAQLKHTEEVDGDVSKKIGDTPTEIKEMENFYKITNAILSQWIIVSFIIFPFFTKRFVLSLLTRKLQPLGTYLRIDYSVNVSSYDFLVVKVHCIWGLLLQSFCTLLMLFAVVLYRKKPAVSKASMILHQDFKHGWVYFEEFNMVDSSCSFLFTYRFLYKHFFL